MSVPPQIDPKRLPRHIAVIMDGNGRWANQRGNNRLFGHRSAVEAVRDTTEAAAEMGVEFLTLFAFSTENWNRPKHEVDGLMTLLVDTISKETATLVKNNVKLSAIGHLEMLPGRCLQNLQESMDKTASNTRMTLTLALSYGSRADITQAMKSIAAEVEAGLLKADQVNEDLISSRLSTSFLPDPELLVRTSGEYRISNFLLWEIAYTEIFITPKLWPDFRRQDLYDAILDYQKRERRFGKISEQIHQS